MKVTSSYWLGLGSGLILSAMLALVITPHMGQAVIPQEPSTASSVPEQATTMNKAEGLNQADLSSTTKPSVSTQPTQVESPKTQSIVQTEQSFIIPRGAGSNRIADLLVAQGLIVDKESFAVAARQMGVERKFRAGTFTLSQGLTAEEVIKRLMK